METERNPPRLETQLGSPLEKLEPDRAPPDFILCEYETRPDVEVEHIQQVRAVRNGDKWELHLVCKVEIPVEDAPGDNTAGIDLGINNYLAIAFDTGEAALYLGNVLKRDRHYFTG